MEKIRYQIEFLSDWHVGSGLDAGAKADNLVLKDDDGLPFIPGKTIKGLLKDALYEMAEVNQIDSNHLYKLMGKDANEKENIPSEKGNAYFSNASLPETERKDLINNNLQEHLYRTISSTRINDKGVADRGSLRTMEVCMPVVLEGEIEYKNSEHKAILEIALKWTRHLGVNRNRGLGRCIFTLKTN
ncbi:MAG: RAMP superfamily CRISPR-associated protein [bacterium]